MGVGIAAYAFITSQKPTAAFPEMIEWLEHWPQHAINLIPLALLVGLLWWAVKSGKFAGPTEKSE